MSVLEQWQGASFRGVPFLVPNESEDTGQKSVSHEYPNSDERFVEQLGRIPSTFKMEGIVHGPDAIQQRIRLIEALNTPGVGDLVHPIYGIVRVKALPYTVRSNQKSFGEFIFSLEFARTKENVTPSPETATPQSVTQIALEVAAAINVALEGDYISPETGSLLSASAGKVIDISDNVSESINLVTDLDSENLATFNRVASAIKTTAFKIAQSPTQLSNSLASLYSTALQVVDTPARLSEAWKLLLDNVEEITDPTDTVKRKNKVTNENMLDEHTRLNTLVNIYEAESYKEFTTQAELEASLEFLNSKYDEYLNDSVAITTDAGIISIVNDPDVRRLFSNLRNTAIDNFNSKAQNLWRVVTISPGRSSMSLTAYKYYGDIDNLDLITGLNPGVNVATFNESELSVVTK